MTRMKDILYFMHVPWGWIKQRPHFLAEGLAKNYKVKVVTEMQYQKADTKNETPVSRSLIYRLPFVRFKVIRKLNEYLRKKQIINKIKRSSIVWFTSPHFMDDIPSNALDGKVVIYDCMDDYLEFPFLKKDEKQKIRNLENELYNKSTIILSSSNYLKLELINRYGLKDVYVVNNAIKQLDAIQMHKELPNKYLAYKQCKKKKIVYIGTISQWFDFELVNYILENSDVEIFLFGPNEITLPNIKGLNNMGVVEHDFIFEIMDNADVLLMPFKINKLIESVNPVKLYEYIYSGKPCIAPFYGESSVFADYVYLYNNKEECLNLINTKNLLPLKSRKECSNFCSENTWVNRIEIINDIIKNNIPK